MMNNLRVSISRTEAQIHTYTEHGVYMLYFLYYRQLLL